MIFYNQRLDWKLTNPKDSRLNGQPCLGAALEVAVRLGHDESGKRGPPFWMPHLLLGVKVDLIVAVVVASNTNVFKSLLLLASAATIFELRREKSS